MAFPNKIVIFNQILTLYLCYKSTSSYHFFFFLKKKGTQLFRLGCLICFLNERERPKKNSLSTNVVIAFTIVTLYLPFYTLDITVSYPIFKESLRGHKKNL